MPELTAETVADMRGIHEQQRTELEVAQRKAISNLESQYGSSLTRIANTIDDGLNRILPDDLVDFISALVDMYLMTGLMRLPL